MPSEVLEHCTIRSSTPTAMSDLEPKHLHLASSFESGWEGVNLILEQEPRGEMPAATMNFHFVTIALDNLSYFIVCKPQSSSLKSVIAKMRDRKARLPQPHTDG
jgi:hypothetical protein